MAEHNIKQYIIIITIIIIISTEGRINVKIITHVLPYLHKCVKRKIIFDWNVHKSVQENNHYLYIACTYFYVYIYIYIYNIGSLYSY